MTSDDDVNPLLVFGGFAASVALVLAIVVCFIAVCRHTRCQPSAAAAAALLAARKRAEPRDTRPPVVGRHRAPADRDVIRLTATELDARPASNSNAVRQLLKTDVADV